MYKRWAALVFFIILLSFTGCASKPSPTLVPSATPLPFPTGLFTNTDWSWEFKSDGTFTSSGPQGSETGTYVASGDQVAITCQCCGNVQGTYKWAFSGGTLTFHAIEDQCFNRLNVVTSGIWSLNP